MLTLRPLGSDAQPQSPRGIQLDCHQDPTHVKKVELSRGLTALLSWPRHQRGSELKESESRTLQVRRGRPVPSKISRMK